MEPMQSSTSGRTSARLAADAQSAQPAAQPAQPVSSQPTTRARLTAEDEAEVGSLLREVDSVETQKASISSAPASRSAAAAPAAPAPINGDAYESPDLLAALDLYRAGSVDEAAEKLAGILRRESRNPVALYLMGMIDLDRGLTERKKASAAPEGDTTARLEYSRKATTYFQSARSNLKTLLSLDRVDPEYRNLRPVEAGLNLGIALLAIDDIPQRLKLTDEAIDILKSYTAEFPDDYLGHFFLGISYWRKAIDFQDAQARPLSAQAFERTQSLLVRHRANPDELSQIQAVELYIRYYNGVQAVYEERYTAAKELLSGVAQDASALEGLGTLRDQSLQLVEKIKEVEKSSGQTITFLQPPVGPIEFRGTLAIGNGYDSNVPLQGDNTELSRRVPRRDDYFFDTFASFDLARRFNNEEENGLWKSMAVGLGADMSHRWHASVTAFDLNQYRARPYLQVEFQNEVFAYLEYQFAYTQLGHDPFITSHDGILALTKRWSDREKNSYGTRADLYYDYGHRNYFDHIADPRLDRDGSYHLIGARQAFDLVRADALWKDYYAQAPEAERVRFGEQRWMNWYLGYEFRDESTQGAEFDLYSHALLTGIFVPLPLRLDFDYRASFSWDNYWNWSLFDFTRDERFDFRQIHSFGLTYTLVRRGEVERMPTFEMRLRGSADLTFQDSNTSDSAHRHVYSYDRGQYGVALIIDF